MINPNLSGTLNVFRILFNPSLCIPHATVSRFSDLPTPLSKAFHSTENVDIRAVVLDKDNCFAVADTNHVYPAYKEKFEQLRQAYPGKRMLIVSNSAGTLADSNDEGAKVLEQNTSVPVLRHKTKKPGCGREIWNHFQNECRGQITSPAQIAVIGDRIFTDVMLANMMGARSIWIRDGIVEDSSIFARAERSLTSFLLKRGYVPPMPKSDFE